MNWYAIYTKPRREEIVARRLSLAGLEIINPMMKFQKYRSNRYDDVIEPLFPCYLFGRFDKERYSHLITYTRGVRYIVGKNFPVVVPVDIVESIIAKMDSTGIIRIAPERFGKGDRVIVRDGPFKDFYAIFEREIRGPQRVLILLDAMNCGLEINSASLAKVS
jgi:transcriptional antiterminator RfaH